MKFFLNQSFESHDGPITSEENVLAITFVNMHGPDPRLYFIQNKP